MTGGNIFAGCWVTFQGIMYKVPDFNFKPHPNPIITMKKLFVMSAIVLGTVAFSACDSKPAETTTESTEMSTDTATMMSTDTTSTMMSTDSSAMSTDTIK